ncbi:hypothetical protein DFQ28_003577 [Apophysomyces sp. BC1034]|nr:hypothetical protein DFQ29_008672 [Apophysomyces sp. BC1021]KAG0189321.1 hypothetical protein DFQ28_003577 [Apophysomyces sp. BC1034]
MQIDPDLSEAVTAKKSRTVKEVKEVLNRLGGSVSSVGWMFDKKGKIVFGPGLSGHDFDQMSDAAIEAGAEDIEFEDDLVEIICEFSQLNAINQALIKENYEIQQMEATYIPQSGTEITDKETFELVDKCIDDMENLDDVVKLHHNAVVAFEDEQQQ